eukprot:CAMPEP_0201525444 /NCGR_PEP_ID=MMETSP0161_2-20130828/28193_1 /ASSEMBLY_ACC=CAM_ASM_000251 /TAXON_ID=180227 /ORGANISM="Neoparamoeba aestuarina, Strain SoJaBio B1-5/56/2" /LENGTH=113 /DNA_ID=CAMNT_0047925361 /DNA_START=47 /DNA_END=388 /DNA_ORIENTATION=+
MGRTVLQHVVIFELENFTEEQEKQAQKQLAIMVEEIPGIITASFAKHVNKPYDTYNPERQKGFTHTLLVTLEDAAALKVYDTAPSHIELVNLLRPRLKNLIATDTIIDTYPEH